MSTPRQRYAQSVDPSVTCATCEAVCCRLTVVLMPQDRVPAHFVDRDDHGLEIMAKNAQGWCAALDMRTFRCGIYADRPSICRKFAMGGPSCRDERSKWFGDNVPAPVAADRQTSK